MWGEVVSRLAHPAESQAAAIAAVIGDDDLLREILLRVGFPSTLVRAALVSRRWLRHASDRAFLRRFRDRHPPRLLGFYINDLGGPRQRFVPVSRAPELAAAVRLAAVAGGYFYVFHSGNGRLRVTEYGETLMDHRNAVLRPLHPDRGTVFLPPPPPEHTRIWFFLAAADDGTAAVGIFSIDTKLQVDLLTLRSGAWVVRRTAVLDHPETLPEITGMLPPAGGKIYMLSHPYDFVQHVLTRTYPARIIRLDMATANVSVISLPDTVRTTNYKLSLGEQQQEEDSGPSLVYAEGYLLSVWRLATNNDGNANEWVLVYAAAELDLISKGGQPC